MSLQKPPNLTSLVIAIEHSTTYVTLSFSDAQIAQIRGIAQLTNLELGFRLAMVDLSRVFAQPGAPLFYKVTRIDVYGYGVL